MSQDDRSPAPEGGSGGGPGASVVGDVAGDPAGAGGPGHGRGRAADQESLSEAFWAVARQLRRTTKQALEPWDITPSHARALGVLHRHGAMRLSELSEHLHIAARSTTEVVDGLADRGLAERRPDPHDRRATLVTLTAEGLRVGESVRAARAAEAEAFFGVLPADDRVALLRILGSLRDDGPS